MAKKSFNEKLRDSKDMPVVKQITDIKSIERNGGDKMLIAPPIDYDTLMRKVPSGKLTSINGLRHSLAKHYGADFTCPLTAGLFVNIAAQASAERGVDETPYWRTLKQNGELNEKYPGGTGAQRERLEREGHTITQKGKRYFVGDFDSSFVEPSL